MSSAISSGGTPETQVVVIGAGLSGLTAARTLAERDIDCIVVEARDRVGGRVRSEEIGDGIFDLGGQWIGDSQPRMQELIKELNIETFPTFHAGRSVMDLGGKVTSYKGTIPSVPPLDLLSLHATIKRTERAAKRVPLDAPWEAVERDQWTGQSAGNFLSGRLATRRVRQLSEVAVRTVFGSEPSELGLLYFLFYLNSGGGFQNLIEIEGGAQQTRFSLGAQHIAERLAQGLGDRVILEAPVRRIDQAGDDVTVSTDIGDIRAKQVICAIPPHLTARIDFNPGLPPMRRQLVERLPMGFTMKVLVLYDTPFWRGEGWSGEAVCSAGPATYIVDNTHDGTGQACLLAFLVGQPGRSWAGRALESRRRALLDQLARYFGPSAETPTEYREMDWSTEAWTGGCPTGVMGPGVMTQYGAALRDPCGAVHWAGTETASDWCGF
ncbi:MAG: monoamine oxidase, partial [Myxococcota bacterium]